MTRKRGGKKKGAGESSKGGGFDLHHQLRGLTGQSGNFVKSKA